MRPRVLIVGLVLLGGLGLGTDVLGDFTQTRPDPVDRQAATEIVLAMHRKPSAGTAAFSAAGLWGACQGTVHRRLQGDGFVAVDGSDVRFRGTVYPALGEHARRRLRGCLEDATVDRVQASVVSMERVPLCGAIGAVGAPGAPSGTGGPRCVVARQANG